MMKNIGMPAKASGLVKSRTLCPASRPSPPIVMTEKSSSLIDTLFCKAGLRSPINGAKSSSACSRGQTMEHSLGVIETFTNGCQKFHGLDGGIMAPSSSRSPLWTSRLSIGWMKRGDADGGRWISAKWVFYRFVSSSSS